jgi:hypothetical protein
MSLLRPALHSLAFVLTAAIAAAQCTPSWQIDSGLGVDGTVYAMVEWDPDGSGPLPTCLVVGGQFATAGSVLASNLAVFDLQTGAAVPLWNGTNGPVRSVAVGLANELIVGGTFTAIDNVAARGIAMFASGVWQPLGTGIDVSRNGVRCLHVQPSGLLIAGGDFGDAGGTQVQNIAAWNGTAWSAIGAGLQYTFTVPTGDVGGVSGLATTAQGLVAAGWFHASGSTQLDSVAAWNGTAWNPVGPLSSPFSRPLVRSLQALPNGDLLVCGVGVIGPSFVMQWNGSAWITLAGALAQPHALAVTPGGDWVVAGGPDFVPSPVQKWTSSGWVQIGVLNQFEWALALAPLASVGPNALAIGGQFTGVSGQRSSALATYQPASGWLGNSRAFTGVQPRVHVSPEGDVLLAGGGAQGGTPLPSLARWNGSSWAPFAGTAPAIDGFAFDNRGGIAVTTAGGVMRWDGVLPSGNLVTADPQCYLWNGSFWANLNRAAKYVVATSRGEIIAGASPNAFPGGHYVARWSGTSWIDIDPTGLIITVYAMVALPDGSVAVADTYYVVRRWDGSSWQAMGAAFNGSVDHLCVLADGRVLATGAFSMSGAVPCPRNAVWNGQSWQPLPAGATSFLDAAPHPDGDLWIITSQHVAARLQTPCPAAVAAFGTACPSSGGANRLGATSWPLLGGRLTSFATGLPSLAIGAAIVGLSQTSVPLPLLLPQGQPGCNLLATPDATVFLPAISGQVAFGLDVPNAPALVGVLLQHQILILETPALGLGPATATNGLSLTVGSVR